jgi:hypothetical protein
MQKIESAAHTSGNALDMNLIKNARHRKEIRNGSENKKGHPSTSRVIIFLMTVSSEIFVYVCMRKKEKRSKERKKGIFVRYKRKKDLYPQQTCEREKSFQRDSE